MKIEIACILIALLTIVLVCLAFSSDRQCKDWRRIAQAELEHIWTMEHMINSVDSTVFNRQDWDDYNESSEYLREVVNETMKDYDW